MEDFCLKLPKIELHAHLTGSIRPETLQEVWKNLRQKDPNLDLGDPVEVLEKAQAEMDAVTFFPLFSKYIYRLCNDAASITHCTRAVLADFAADGVSYLELRTIPRASSDLSAEAYVALVLDVIASQPAGQKPPSTYLILGVDRKNSPAEAAATVDIALRFRRRGVVGVDLAGNPARGADRVVLLGDAYARARMATDDDGNDGSGSSSSDNGGATGGRLGITLHFAELAASSSDEELRALLSYGPTRLGHVICPPDWAKEEIRRKKIGLELCLTCNVNAKLIDGGYANHHFGYWRDKGCPIAICTDDVGIFGSKVSNEWLMLTKHFNLSKQDAIEVCKSGIDSIFGSETDKQRLRRELDAFASASTSSA